MFGEKFITGMTSYHTLQTAPSLSVFIATPLSQLHLQCSTRISPLTNTLSSSHNFSFPRLSLKSSVYFTTHTHPSLLMNWWLSTPEIWVYIYIWSFMYTWRNIDCSLSYIFICRWWTGTWTQHHWPESWSSSAHWQAASIYVSMTYSLTWLACCYVDLLCVGAIYGICTADSDLNTRQVILHIIWMTV